MKKVLVAGVLVAIVAAFGWSSIGASSHREAPLISMDPTVDNTDVYAFVNPNRPDKVVLIANFIPFQYPSGGPNFFRFDDNALYEIHIDNTGDAVEDITYQFDFHTFTKNPNTFLYNTGQVTSITDPDLNVIQYFTMTRVNGPRRTGSQTVMARDLHVNPYNVGTVSMPDYDALSSSANHFLASSNTLVYTGPRDEGFFIDVGATFDLLQFRTLVPNLGVPIDGLAGFNVHTIAVEVPISALTRTGTRPTQASDPNATIGVWSTASRQMVTTRFAGSQSHSGDWVQVSRLGNPLVNELVIPLSTKDAFNSLHPTGDGAALPFVTNPIVPPLLNALFGVQTPPTPRNDLVTIFLTGIPGLNQIGASPRASEMLRLNTAVPPSASPHRLGVLAGDLAGFPNGRRVGDDVVDIALQAMAGATPLTPEFQRSPNNTLGDGINTNEQQYLSDFPFLRPAHAGRDPRDAPRVIPSAN